MSRLTESDLKRVVKLVLNEGKQWVAQTSYNIGRVGFDQVLNKGSVFNATQGIPGVNAMCINKPFSQDDPLYFSCVGLVNKIGEKSKLYEMTFGARIPYFNQQLEVELLKTFCPSTKTGGGGVAGAAKKLPPYLMKEENFKKLYQSLVNGKSGVKIGGSGDNMFLYAGMWVIWKNKSRNGGYFISTGKGPSTQLFKLGSPLRFDNIGATQIIRKDGKQATFSDIIPGLVKSANPDLSLTGGTSTFGQKLQKPNPSKTPTTKTTTGGGSPKTTTTKTGTGGGSPKTTTVTTKAPTTGGAPTTGMANTTVGGLPTKVPTTQNQLTGTPLKESSYNFKRLLNARSGNVKPLLD